METWKISEASRIISIIEKHRSINEKAMTIRWHLVKINENSDLAQMLHNSDQDISTLSLSLQPGFEYVVDVSVTGQTSTEGFKDLDSEKRGCKLDNEVDKKSDLHHILFARTNVLSSKRKKTISSIGEVLSIFWWRCFSNHDIYNYEFMQEL